MSKNGGIKGTSNTTSLAQAKGRWGVKDVYAARKTNTWAGYPLFEYLFVGGGGAGGINRGGGGGAGGFITNSQVLQRSFYLSVGAGGATNTTGGNGSNGSDTYLTYLSPAVNLVQNPSMETGGIQFWTTYNGNTVELKTGLSLFGNNSLQVNSNNTDITDVYEDFARRSADPINPYSVGNYFTYSAYFLAGTSGRTVFLQARCFDASGVVTGELSSPTITPNASTWTRTHVTFQVPANTVAIGLNIKFPAGSTGTTFVDGIMYQTGQVLSEYPDPAICAYGGGAAGRWAQNSPTVNGAGKIGGSGGGGGAADTGSPGVAGSGIAGQGNAGGSGRTEASRGAGGGGGGASQVGQAGQVTNGGNGGNGSASSITGTSVTYAGGGGGGIDTGAYNNGGTGGLGGGANGANKTSDAIAASANTGGGGGGGSFDRATSTQRLPSTGGSGIIVLKYPSSLTLTIGPGLISSTTTSGDFKITTFTAGTGTITF